MASWLDMLAGSTHGSYYPGKERAEGIGRNINADEATYYGEPPEPTEQERNASDIRMSAIRDMLGIQTPDLYMQSIPRTYSPELKPGEPGRRWEPEGWNRPRVSEWQPDASDRLVDVLGSTGPVINGVFEALGPRSKAYPDDNTFDRFSRGYRSGEYTLKDVRRKKKEGTEQYPYGKP